MKTQASDLLTTPIAFSIHRRDANPIFGESAIKVTVDDEAAGPFIILESNADEEHHNMIRIDFDELEAVANAARHLQSVHTKLGGAQ